MFYSSPPLPPEPSLVRTYQADRAILAMGTRLELHLEGSPDAREPSEAALGEVVRIERACSTWDPASEWSRLNAAEGRPVHLAPEWFALLADMKAWNSRTEGAFDPVLGALIQAWGTREGGRVPSPGLLASARAAAGAGLLVLDAATGTARLAHPAAGLEEGGFLKGYALDRMRAISRATAGLLDFGGQLLAWGRPRSVSVADPLDRQRPRLSFVLENASLSCSGTSERGRHILDPRTGQPCETWGATAVVAPDGLAADILSTALYVLGPDRGLAWARRHRVAAAFLLNDGTVRLSPAFLSLKPLELR
jgi:FAD:protein FMN transferase